MISQDKLIKILFSVAAVLVSVCIIATAVLFSYGKKPSPVSPTETGSQTDTESRTESATDSETESASIPASVILDQTPDMGQEYLDRFAFLGESTTAHLRSRGVLSGGTNSPQVWVGPSNTLTIGPGISRKKLTCTKYEDSMSVSELAESEKPEYLILCFGLNGIKTFMSNKDTFLSGYQELIDAVRKASPGTKIILQSIYPIAKDADKSSDYPFSDSPEKINQWLRTVNDWTIQLAVKNGLRYLDAASAVTGEDGYLIAEYAISDGIHIEAAGYQKVLAYIRTHGYS